MSYPTQLTARQSINLKGQAQGWCSPKPQSRRCSRLLRKHASSSKAKNYSSCFAFEALKSEWFNCHTPHRTELTLILRPRRYVDRLASNLRQQKYHSATILGRIGKLEEQRAAAQALIEDSTPKIAALIKQTKVLQGNVEKSISGLYKGRPVNIIGDVNNL